MYNQNTKFVAVSLEHGILAWAETAQKAEEIITDLANSYVAYEDVVDTVIYEAYSKENFEDGVTYILPCDPRFFDYLKSTEGVNYKDYEVYDGIVTFG